MKIQHSASRAAGAVCVVLALGPAAGQLPAEPLPSQIQEAPKAEAAEETQGARKEVRKELRDDIYLSSGVEVSRALQEQRVTQKNTLKNRLVEVFTVGPSEAKTQRQLWLVRAASLELVGALGRRLAAKTTIEVLTPPADGLYILRGTEKEIWPALKWEEVGWLGEFDWTLKLSPELKQAVDAVQMNLTTGNRSKVYIGQQALGSEAQQPVDQQALAGIPTGEPSMPLEVWLFSADELNGFLDRLEVLLGRDRSVKDDGSIHFGRVIVVPQSEKLESPNDRVRRQSWVRIKWLPLRQVPEIAADLAVSRILPGSTVEAFRGPGGRGCKEKLEEWGVDAEMILARVPGIWTAPAGLNGSGEIIGHADSGFDSGTDIFRRNSDLQGSLEAATSLGRSDGKWFDLTGHGTHTAGLLVGNGMASFGRYRGVAPEAHIIHHALADANGVFREDREALVQFLEGAIAANARIHSDSWGKPSGSYAPLSSWLDAWTWNGGNPRNLLVVMAAGNAGQKGQGTIASPADAKNCLAVGAVETDNLTAVAAFSSRGPTVDGRFKPDLVAPGTFLVSTRPLQVAPLLNETMEAGDCCNGWTSWPKDAPIPWTASTEAHDGSASLTDSRDGNYADNTQIILASPKFSVSSTTEISFWARWQVPEPSPHGFSILFGDVDRWEATAIRMPPTNPNWPDWDLITLELPDIVKVLWSMVRVGFLLSSDGDGHTADGIYIDDFRVSGWRADCGMAEAGLASSGSREDETYAVDSGTSMATPLVAGLGALYRQYLRTEHGLSDPSAMTLKAALINGSDRPAGRDLPDNQMGFGVAGMGLVERSGVLVWEAVAPDPVGPPVAIEIDVTSSDEALRATLVWWDSPGPQLNNDLDLSLRSPSGAVWPEVADSVNTVEDLFVANPETGRWTIEVAAGALQRSSLPFSLVVSGGLEEVLEGGDTD